jgi:hypothetical protein
MGVQQFEVVSDLMFVDNSQARVLKQFGTTWYVDTNNGSDSKSGKSWNRAFLTMDKAFDSVGSGDTILFVGNVNEQLTTPLGANDVTVMGPDSNPRHADTHPLNGELSASTWKIGSLSSAPLCIVRSPGWTFKNILFAAHSANYAIRLDRNAVEDSTEEDASHLQIENCRFASGAGGINDTGGCFNVQVVNNSFQALTTACIIGVGNIGVGQLMWRIENNLFYGFTNGVKIAAHGCRIQNNTFTDGGTPNTTYVLNTNNGGGADNFVVNNFFQTADANYSTPDLVGTTTDVWVNMLKDSVNKNGTP